MEAVNAIKKKGTGWLLRTGAVNNSLPVTIAPVGLIMWVVKTTVVVGWVTAGEIAVLFLLSNT